MPGTDRLFVGHMLDTLDRINELVGRTSKAEFDGEGVIQSALMRELEVLGEAAGRVSPEFVKAHPEIPWREITGIRHKLIHDYFEVDTEVVRHGAHPERIADRWYILSAEHGLVRPDKVLEPYEKTLNHMRRADRDRWAARVREQLGDVLPAGAEVIVLAGQRYREGLVPVQEPGGRLPHHERVLAIDAQTVGGAETPSTSPA